MCAFYVVEQNVLSIVKFIFILLQALFD